MTERARLERGVYAQGWFARGYNYHPSLPPRRLKMVQDFAEYRATMITWPSLGGGPISLAYLEQEAYAPIPARYRQYGYLKDSEFLAECRARGVKAFSVVFSTQGWEFPVELNDAEDEILAMNELRGVGKRGWLGLREFTQNRYPGLWAPFEKYFPDGIRNSRGELVTDLFEEASGRDIHGNALHADWLEVPEREHICHYMDINNPVWREYLKAIVRIHVDAGVDGIQFDEPDSPISSLRYGGCFCYDCMTGFAEYLARQPEHDLPADVAASLPAFDYRSWLLGQGRSGFDPVNPDALADHYVHFLQERVAINFAELAEYAREYSRSRGRQVLISANLYDGAPWTDPMAEVVDILVPEQRHTLYRQPGWMRYLAGFADGRPTCISFNPYGGVIPELAPALERGRGIDRLRVMLYEAAAMGVNMSVPYGAWMGAMIEDAMWAPHEETVEVQNFIADHENTYGSRTENAIAVVYSLASNFLPLTYAGALQARIDPVTKRRGEPGEPVAFFAVAENLGQASIPLDAIVFHDGRLRDDTASAEQLERYARVILPGCTELTPRQFAAVHGYLERGGQVTVVGELGPAGDAASRILEHPSTLVVSRDADNAVIIPERQQVTMTGSPAVGVNIVRTDDGAAVHLVNYEYDHEHDRTPILRDIYVEVRLPDSFETEAIVHMPGVEATTTEVRFVDGAVRLTLAELGQYTIVELRTVESDRG
jgi:hypothetical protein